MNESRVLSFAGIAPPKLIGAAFMLLWALVFSLAMATAKTLSPEVDTLILLFMRYFFGLVFFSPFLMKSDLKDFKTSRPLLHVTRIMCMGAAMGCTYYAYRNLPLALATSIGMTGPLFTTMLSMLLLKDSVSFPKWALFNATSMSLEYCLNVSVAARPETRYVLSSFERTKVLALKDFKGNAMSVVIR